MTARLPDPARWRGRRVLLTGHTGFKGAWLARWLARMGAEVHGLALAPRPGSLAARGAVPVASEAIADIRDARAVEAAVSAARPEVAFHLAAMALVPEAHADPAAADAINAGGTYLVLDALARLAPELRAAVVVTTDKVYRGEPRESGFREDDPLGSMEPYGASKAKAEAIVADARAALPFPVATARAGNCIGGGDNAPWRLVPDIIAASHAGTPLALRNPAAVRPWQHALEPLNGYLLLAESLLDGKPVTALNFGPGRAGEASVGAIVEAFAAHGFAPRIEAAAPTGVAESAVLRLDARHAAQVLRWAPRWTLAEAIARTAAFHRALASGADAGALMDADLEAFTA